MPTAVETRTEMHTIVLLGNFNPAIFHPQWFAENNLLPLQETEEATQLVVSSEVTNFAVSNLEIQAEQQKFAISTNDPSKYPVVRDLVLGCFQLLEHTPLIAVGMNFNIEFKLPDATAWHEVGHRLAPKHPWEGILEQPGMLAVVMEGKRSGTVADKILVRVQPTVASENAVLVAINQHYQLNERFTLMSGRNRELIRLLQEDWLPFRHYAYETSNSLVAGPS